MAFDQLNYSTEGRDDDSIQDCIDREHNSIRENLSILKSEILSHFETVQVDIFEQGSHLNMRSRDGTIIGKLHDNVHLNVLGDHILGPKNKVFLHIRTPQGKDGYVSADYVQGEYCPQIENDDIEILTIAPKLFENLDEDQGNTTIPNNIEEPPLPTESPNTLNIPDTIDNDEIDSTPLDKPVVQLESPSELITPEFDDSTIRAPYRDEPRFTRSEAPSNLIMPNTDTPIDIETDSIENLAATVLGFMRSGALYIVGENGEDTLVEYNDFTQEQKENIDILGDVGVKIDNLMLIIQALSVSGESTRFVHLENAILQLAQDIDITSNSGDVENRLNELQGHLGEMTKQSLGRSQFRNPVAQLDLSNTTQVLSYIRNSLGSHEIVNNEILELRFGLLGISDGNLSEFISDPTSDISSIQDIFGEDIDAYIDFKIKINEKRAQANNYFIEHKQELMINNSIDEATAKELVIQSFLGNYTRSLLMNHYIVNLSETGYWTGYQGDDALLKMYGDIQGIGANDLSDATWNLVGEGAQLLAVEALAIGAGMLTMGAGTVAIHAAVWGTRGYKGARALQQVSRVAHLGLKAGEYTRLQIMGARALRFGAMGGAEGVTFAAGMGGAKTLIEGENMYSQEMLVQSLGFTYAFRGLTGIYSSLGMRLDPALPLSAQKLTFSKQVIGDGAAFSALGLQFEGVLFQPGEWSAETILQALFMAALFRGLGHSLDRYRFRKNDEGDVIIEELPLLDNPVIPPNRRINHHETAVLDNPVIPPNRRINHLDDTGTQLLANPLIPVNRRLAHIREFPSTGLKEISYINPKNGDNYIVIGTNDRIISVRLESPIRGGNGVLGGGARNIFILNNESNILAVLRANPPLNNGLSKTINFTTPQRPNGSGGETYEVFATKRSGNWEYYPMKVDSSLPHSGNLGTAVLRDFQNRYDDQILELLNRL